MKDLTLVVHIGSQRWSWTAHDETPERSLQEEHRFAINGKSTTHGSNTIGGLLHRPAEGPVPLLRLVLEHAILTPRAHDWSAA